MGKKKKVFLLILWVSLLLLGIVKQAPWILFFILLILTYSRDGIMCSIFETGCMSITSIFILFNYCWTCHILSFRTCVICAWKIESSWTAVSFSWQYCREYRQHWENTDNVLTTEFSFHCHIHSSRICLHCDGSHTFFKRKATAHCV